ncbi:MAG: hypothetical protein LBG48_00430 [Rickettsiales bacterium]|jgi:hypothetical protein|nr:hypothetical protein [Rickettsiales bacterium]
MKGDIVLKVIIAFIIPFMLMYSSVYIFYVYDLGFLSVLNSFITVSITYALFFLRFGKINVKKITFVSKLLSLLLVGFFVVIFFLLKKLIEV